MKITHSADRMFNVESNNSSSSSRRGKSVNKYMGSTTSEDRDRGTRGSERGEKDTRRGRDGVNHLFEYVPQIPARSQIHFNEIDASLQNPFDPVHALCV